MPSIPQRLHCGDRNTVETHHEPASRGRSWTYEDALGSVNLVPRSIAIGVLRDPALAMGVDCSDGPLGGSAACLRLDSSDAVARPNGGAPQIDLRRHKREGGNNCQPQKHSTPHLIGLGGRVTWVRDSSISPGQPPHLRIGLLLS